MANGSLIWICIVAFFGASTAMPLEMTEGFEEFRSACISNSGSDEGYKQVMRSIQSTQECVNDIVNLEQLPYDIMFPPSGNWKAAYLSYCPKFNQTLPCFDNILDGATKCVGKDVEQLKAVFRNTFYNLMNLLCEEELRIFTELRRSEFKPCLTQFGEFAEECGLENITTSGSLSSFTEENCQSFEQSRECIKTKVDECRAPFLMEIYDVFYKAIKQGSSCNQFHKSIIDNQVRREKPKGANNAKPLLGLILF